METKIKIPEVKDNQKFIQTETYAINHYIALCRTLGDNRTENEIVLEWIDENAARFRENFVLVTNHA
jgi:hypothetical protein